MGQLFFLMMGICLLLNKSPLKKKIDNLQAVDFFIVISQIQFTFYSINL